MATVTILPRIAKTPFPDLRSLWHGFWFYRDASPGAKKQFCEARRRLFSLSPLTCSAQQQKTSGSTGKRKEYEWGPCFETVDRFFHTLFRDGDRLNKTCELHVLRFLNTGQDNVIEHIEYDKGYAFQKHIYLRIHGNSDILDLKKELAGYNVFISPSMYLLLEHYIPIEEYFDRDALLLFTGEILPAELALRLRGHWDVRDYMRCWDGGATFYTCRFGHKHWLSFLAETWLEEGHLYANDWFNLRQPHLHYFNGDRLTVHEYGICSCGQTVLTTEFKNRSENTCFLTPSGIVATYEILYSAVASLGRPLLFACFGKILGKSVDDTIIVHYLTAVPVDKIEFEHDLEKLFFATFGVWVVLHDSIESSKYKIQKIFFLE